MKLQQKVRDNSVPVTESGCWLWLGRLMKNGYGAASRPYRTAHRLSYVAFKGAIPKDLEIDHLCNVRLCVNPEHLELVTHAENMARMRSRDTHCPAGHAYGENGNLAISPAKNGDKQYTVKRCRECHRTRQRKYWKLKQVKARYGIEVQIVRSA